MLTEPRDGMAVPSVLMYHSSATDLTLSAEAVQKKDDPMRYFYHVRLIEEGAPDGIPSDHAFMSGNHEEGAKWEGSVMEVQADKIS